MYRIRKCNCGKTYKYPLRYWSKKPECKHEWSECERFLDLDTGRYNGYEKCEKCGEKRWFSGKN